MTANRIMNAMNILPVARVRSYKITKTASKERMNEGVWIVLDFLMTYFVNFK
jgi:hypothetical protein